MQTIILAGGLGTRLRPITHQIPKPMVLIKGKPFLEYQLKLLKKNGLGDIVLCIGYLGEKIKDYFGNGERLGLNILYSYEETLLGTGGALKNAEGLLENEFLLLFGDTFLNVDYQDIISCFHKKQNLGTMVIFQNRPKITLNNIEVNNENMVINYDKKKEGRTNGVDAGVQIFKKDILSLIPSDEIVSLEEKIFPLLIQKRELNAYLTNQKFYDIGSFEQLKAFRETQE